MSRPSTSTNIHAPSTPHTGFPALSANPYSRTMTLWIHDPDQVTPLSRHEAVLNCDLFPPGYAKPGDVAEVKLIRPGQGAGGLNESGSESPAEMMERRSSYVGSTLGDEDPFKHTKPNVDEEEQGRFLFVIRELTESQRKVNLQVNDNPGAHRDGHTSRNLQISLANHVATMFGFPSRATVKVTIVGGSPVQSTEALAYTRNR